MRAIDGFGPRPILILGLLFALLPLMAGAMYRTYFISVAPEWLEGTRQVGLLFVIAELLVVWVAVKHGLRLSSYWKEIGKISQIALLVFFATFWASSMFKAPHPRTATFLSTTWILHLTFGVSIHYLMPRLRRGDVLAFGRCLIAGFLLFLPLIAFHFSFPPLADTVPGGWLDWGSAIPGFISVRLFGAYAAAIVALAIGMIWVVDPRGRSARISYSVLTLCLTAMIWSGTRAALLGTAAALLAGLLVMRKLPKRLVLLLPVCCAVATCLALLMVPDGDSRFLLFTSGDAASTNQLSGGRLEYWNLIWNAYLQAPVFGWGSGSSFWLVEIYNTRHVQPHNVVLQFLLSWGLPATVAALTLLAIATWQAHRCARGRPWQLPLILMLDSLLAISFVDGTLYFPRFVMLIMALFALSFSGHVGVGRMNVGSGGAALRSAAAAHSFRRS
jgi:exopolysaccharide production protein ExoQ